MTFFLNNSQACNLVRVEIMFYSKACNVDVTRIKDCMIVEEKKSWERRWETEADVITCPVAPIFTLFTLAMEKVITRGRRSLKKPLINASLIRSEEGTWRWMPFVCPPFSSTFRLSPLLFRIKKSSTHHPVPSSVLLLVALSIGLWNLGDV